MSYVDDVVHSEHDLLSECARAGIHPRLFGNFSIVSRAVSFRVRSLRVGSKRLRFRSVWWDKAALLITALFNDCGGRLNTKTSIGTTIGTWSIWSGESTCTTKWWSRSVQRNSCCISRPRRAKVWSITPMSFEGISPWNGMVNNIPFDHSKSFVSRSRGQNHINGIEGFWINAKYICIPISVS